jgi:hypothetical protein
VPRPRVVSRILTYRDEGVRATYRADAPFGAPPAVRRWKLAGYADPASGEPLDPDAAGRRMVSGGRGGAP